MTKMTYREQLLHPNWQRKRLEILERDEFTCQRCYDKESTLHVHHKHYTKGAMVWEYQNHELVTYCETCHEAAHADERLHNDLFARLPVDGPKNGLEALSLLAGWALDRGERIDAQGYFTLDARAFFLGYVASRIGDALGYTTRPARDLSNALVAATDEQVQAWIELIKSPLKE